MLCWNFVGLSHQSLELKGTVLHFQCGSGRLFLSELPHRRRADQRVSLCLCQAEISGLFGRNSGFQVKMEPLYLLLPQEQCILFISSFLKAITGNHEEFWEEPENVSHRNQWEDRKGNGGSSQGNFPFARRFHRSDKGMLQERGLPQGFGNEFCEIVNPDRDQILQVPGKLLQKPQLRRKLLHTGEKLLPRKWNPQDSWVFGSWWVYSFWDLCIN